MADLDYFDELRAKQLELRRQFLARRRPLRESERGIHDPYVREASPGATSTAQVDPQSTATT